MARSEFIKKSYLLLIAICAVCAPAFGIAKEKGCSRLITLQGAAGKVSNFNTSKMKADTFYMGDIDYSIGPQDGYMCASIGGRVFQSGQTYTYLSADETEGVASATTLLGGGPTFGLSLFPWQYFWTSESFIIEPFFSFSFSIGSINMSHQKEYSYESMLQNQIGWYTSYGGSTGLKLSLWGKFSVFGSIGRSNISSKLAQDSLSFQTGLYSAGLLYRLTFGGN